MSDYELWMGKELARRGNEILRKVLQHVPRGTEEDSH